MKTQWLMGIVAAVHAVALGSAVLIQGCGTAEGPKTIPEPTPAPPAPAAKDPAVRPPSTPKGPAATQAPTVETTTYAVASGDTLSSIARRFNTTVPELMALNSLANPNRLRIGQKLRVPRKAGATSAPVAPRERPKPATPDAPAARLEQPAPAPAPQPPKAAPVIAPPPPPAPEPAPAPPPAAKGAPRTMNYTVQAGETLRTIAMNRALSVSQLRELNDIPEGVEVKSGQVIKIPLAE